MASNAANAIGRKVAITVCACVIGCIVDCLIHPYIMALLLPTVIAAVECGMTRRFLANLLAAAHRKLNVTEEEDASEPTETDVLIGECLRRGAVAEAEARVQEELSAGRRVTATTFNIMVAACLRDKRQEDARRWLEKMLVHGVPSDAKGCDAVVDACAKVGSVSEAEDWLEKMLEKGVHANPASYVAIIFAHCRNPRHVHHAEAWLERMLKNINTEVLQNYSVAVTACHNLVIRALTCAGEIQQAEAWLQSLRRVGEMDVGSFCPLICAYARTGDAPAADDAMMRMLRASIEGDNLCYRAVILAWSQAGDAAQVSKWVKRAQAEGMDPGLPASKK